MATLTLEKLDNRKDTVLKVSLDQNALDVNFKVLYVEDAHIVISGDKARVNDVEIDLSKLTVLDFVKLSRNAGAKIWLVNAKYAGLPALMLSDVMSIKTGEYTPLYSPVDIAELSTNLMMLEVNSISDTSEIYNIRTVDEFNNVIKLHPENNHIHLTSTNKVFFTHRLKKFYLTCQESKIFKPSSFNNQINQALVGDVNSMHRVSINGN